MYRCQQALNKRYKPTYQFHDKSNNVEVCNDNHFLLCPICISTPLHIEYAITEP